MRNRNFIFILLLISAAYFARNKDENKVTGQKINAQQTKKSRIKPPIPKIQTPEPKPEPEISEYKKQLRINHLIFLEDKLNPLPEVVSENYFSYTKRQINYSEEEYGLYDCEYELEPDDAVVQTFFFNHEKQVRVSLNHDSKLPVLLDMIDEYILTENNPYLTQGLDYNCRIDITKRYILDELEKLAEPLT